jgi:hypothetical protein
MERNDRLRWRASERPTGREEPARESLARNRASDEAGEA